MGCLQASNPAAKPWINQLPTDQGSSAVCPENLCATEMLLDVDSGDQVVEICQSHIGYVQDKQEASAATACQRAGIVDNLMTAAAALCLSNDALFLAVACFDKYLSVVQTPSHLLKPVGIACLWTAAKYDCAVAPRAASFASLLFNTSGCISKPENTAAAVQTLVAFEAVILSSLDYRLASVDTIKQHKHEIFQRTQNSSYGSLGYQQQQQHLYNMTSYLTEVSLLEYQLLPCPPSKLAAAAYALAHVLLGYHLDCKHLPQMTGYGFADLHIPLQYLCALHTTLYQALLGGTPYAVSVKYSSPAMQEVAYIAPLVDTQDPRLA